MQTVKTACLFEETIKKSRFIGYLIPCENESAIAAALQRLHAEHPNASHIAFAYRVQTAKGMSIRFNDAGEPSGTAGKPILQHLDGRQIINSLAVVVRYFGGIKLGAGGLTRAYGNTAKKVIDNAELCAYIETTNAEFILEYGQFREFEYHLAKFDGKIINQTFADTITVTIEIPTANLPAFNALFC